MESRESKSSSGKSVGSSYSGYEAKRSTISWIKRKEQTPVGEASNIRWISDASFSDLLRFVPLLSCKPNGFFGLPNFSR
ncbi:hypothetical protein V6N13_062152 [Hibiscus sabdariffa]|uniref:Uncharacterized protein n=2 Tax=Hibiscus sabdariffa TaxID=183260 RepID=A0ABR2BPL4_9ROSI